MNQPFERDWRNPTDGSFTLAGYRACLERTIGLYDVVDFDVLGDPELPNRSVCLIRHDIDISPSRAVQMARIEAEFGVHATYTVLMTGRFYNPLERDVRDQLLEIVAMGHRIGLHFDAAWHEVEDEETLSNALGWEVQTLGNVLKGVHIDMFSFHDPSDVAMSFQAPQYSGLWNAYSAVQRANFSYLSDSNGYWRFRNWNEALDEHPERLHVLTHPEWWVERFAPPAERISTAITERSIYMWQKYCAGLVATFRQNKSDIEEALEILPVALGAGGDRIAQQWLSGDRTGGLFALLRAIRRRGAEAPEAFAPLKGDVDRLASAAREFAESEEPGLDVGRRDAFTALALLLQRLDQGAASRA
jgi:hypothetical protein